MFEDLDEDRKMKHYAHDFDFKEGNKACLGVIGGVALLLACLLVYWAL